MSKTINVNCPAYRGAPLPKFDEMRINESRFEDELRGKNWDARIEIGSMRLVHREN